MKRIKFRHNKYSPGVLYILVIFGVAAGLLAFFGFLTISGIDKGPEYGPIYFREHPIHAVYLIFALIPIFMLFPTWIVQRKFGVMRIKKHILTFTKITLN